MLFVDRALVSVIFWAVFALVGCSSTGGSSPVGVAKAQVRFIDLRGFDRDLAASLSATEPKVDVTFVEPVSPNALPECVQSWMASVEDGGASQGNASTLQRHRKVPAPAHQRYQYPLVGGLYGRRDGQDCHVSVGTWLRR